MTTIAAAYTNKGIVLAADTRVVCGFDKFDGASPKLWVAGPYSMGGAGSVRALQVMKHFVEWPRFWPDDPDVEGFLVKQVVPAIRKAAADQKVAQTEDGLEYVNAHLVIAFNDWLVEIEPYGSVEITWPGRIAIGSGAHLALGKLGDKGPWTERDLVNAVRAASTVDMGTGGPVIHTLNASTQRLKVHPPKVE